MIIESEEQTSRNYSFNLSSVCYRSSIVSLGELIVVFLSVTKRKKKKQDTTLLGQWERITSVAKRLGTKEKSIEEKARGKNELLGCVVYVFFFSSRRNFSAIAERKREREGEIERL